MARRPRKQVHLELTDAARKRIYKAAHEACGGTVVHGLAGGKFMSVRLRKDDVAALAKASGREMKEPEDTDKRGKSKKSTKKRTS